MWLLMVIPVKTNRSDLSVFAGCGVRLGSGGGQEDVPVTRLWSLEYVRYPAITEAEGRVKIFLKPCRKYVF